jgi:mannosyltransferase
VATWSAATRGWTGLARLVHHQDAVFALYYAAMHLWTSVAGVSATALRLPSAIAAVATVAVTARLTHRLTGSRGAGIAAGLWLAVNPFFVFYGATARPYALLALVAAATTDLVAGADAPTRRTVAWYAVLSAVGVYLHLLYGLLVLAQTLGLAATDRRRARRFLLAWTGIAAASVPLLVAGTGQRAQISWIPRAQAADYQTWWAHLVGHGRAPALAFAVFAVIGVTAGGLRQPARAVLAASAVLGSIVLVTVSWWWPIYDARYVVESTPAIAVLVAAGVLRVARSMFRRPWATGSSVASTMAAAMMLLYLAACALNVRASWTQQRRPFFYENLAAAAESLRDATANGAAVIFMPAEARGSLYYYLDRDQDGDLRIRDLAAAHGTTPLTVANFSGLNQSLAQTLSAAKPFHQLVLVELGAAPAGTWKQLTAAWPGTYDEHSQYFGGMTLIVLRRS